MTPKVKHALRAARSLAAEARRPDADLQAIARRIGSEVIKLFVDAAAESEARARGRHPFRTALAARDGAALVEGLDTVLTVMEDVAARLGCPASLAEQKAAIRAMRRRFASVNRGIFQAFGRAAA
jgi:hypothetical protein